MALDKFIPTFDLKGLVDKPFFVSFNCLIFNAKLRKMNKFFSHICTTGIATCMMNLTNFPEPIPIRIDRWIQKERLNSTNGIMKTG